MDKSFLRENERYLRELDKVAASAEKEVIEDIPGTMKEESSAGMKAGTFVGRYPRLLACAAAAVRAGLGFAPRRCQLVAALSLLDAKAVEMGTGEGKTVVAAMASVMMAAMGVRPHVMTANGYLASRDSSWMAPVFRAAGLECAAIGDQETAKAMGADVVYGDAKTFATCWLLSKTVRDKGASPFPYSRQAAIVDEADKVLIDDARLPVSVTGQAVDAAGAWTRSWKAVDDLVEGEDADFTADPDDMSFSFTEKGVEGLEGLFGVESLYSLESGELLHFLSQCVKARCFMEKDRDYVVDSGKVVAIDTTTGRRSPGRFLNGLHQAIEAKEGVPVLPESRVTGKVSMKNFLSGYSMLCGMSGTVVNDMEEIREVYGMGCVVIPPHVPSRRKDLPDLVFPTVDDKLDRIADDIRTAHGQGRPVLVGCEDPVQAMALSTRLGDIPHAVLDAKAPEGEADIVAKAGDPGVVTITANMAGRGTDIVLGDGVADRGGLLVIGASRLEARRLDDQLRGRAGRQGDPGETRFYISMEDRLMRILGAETVKPLVEKLGEAAREGLESRMVSSAMYSAQRRLESAAQAARRSTREWDDVIDRQRGIVYELRDRILSEEDLRPVVMDMLSDLEAMDGYDMKAAMGGEDAESAIANFDKAFATLAESAGTDRMANGVLRNVFLSVVDDCWQSQMAGLERLGQNMSARSHASRNIRLDVKRDAFESFRQMYRTTLDRCVRASVRLRLEKVEKKEAA